MRKSSPVKNREVVYTPEVMRRIVSRVWSAFPNELGGFLFAPSPFQQKPETYHITACEFGKIGTNSKWEFTDSELSEAVRKASRRGLFLVGYFHSHPWQTPPYCMFTQSQADADLQEYFSMPLSLIVGVCPTYWVSAAWRLGYAAPYPQRVGKELVHNWAKNSPNPIVSKHFYCV